VVPVPLPEVRRNVHLYIPDCLLTVYLYYYILEIASSPRADPARTDDLYPVA